MTDSSVMPNHAARRPNGVGLLSPPRASFCPRLAGDGRFRFRRTLRLGRVRIQLAHDAIVDPVLVPPLARIHLHAIDLHAEVNVDAAANPVAPATPRL